MFDAHELIVMTTAEAEAVLDAIDNLKSIAPASSGTLSDDFKGAVAVWYDLMKDNGWRWRASDLSAALQDEGNPYTDGFSLQLAWKIRSGVLEVWDRFDRLGNAAAGGAVDLAPLEEYLTKTQAEILQTADALLTIMKPIIDSSRELTQLLDVQLMLEDRLGPLAVGKAIDFNAVFAPYLPDEKLRGALLVRLANDAQFAGAVDTSRGLVFKTSGSGAFRVFTYVSPLIFFAIAFGVLVGVSSLHPLIPALPTKLGPPWDKLIGPYLLVMAGVSLHLLTANIKQGQAEVQIIATQDFLTWIHLRWLGLALTYVEVVVVVVALRVLGVGDTSHDILLWIAAGYSVDSLAGLVLNRFATGSSAVTQVTAVLSK